LKVVIIGSGHAGFTAVNKFLKSEEELEITMITEDPYPFYPRPVIYKIILGEKTENVIRYPEKWYVGQNINLILNKRVTDIKSKDKYLLTEDGTKLAYDKLLITTGSKPFIPPIPGIHDGPVYHLRSIDDALNIREKALSCKTKKATILGGGLLSVELAKTLSDIGILPTIIDRSPYLLRKQLDGEGGHFFNKVLDKTLNTRFLFNSTCQKIQRNGEKITIEIKDVIGISNHQCEFLLNATGIQNDNSLAQKAGLSLGDYAISVNPYMQTSNPSIYAAGDAVDIGSFPGSKFGIIPTAIDQARVAAQNILGKEIKYPGTVPWTTLKVAGVDLTSMGNIVVESGVEEKGLILDFDKGIYRKLFFKDQKLRGVILIGTRKNLRTLKRLTSKNASFQEVKTEINLD
jgi:nitrite reductase (NADH) large subunit